ncbi:MAG: efflux RND transporter periplasmic adaptor subunit [Acidobacteria bacterium]|nr:efflux RND transporter periplasmic adaptor subunit [Acidobacteriota bacterium]
MRRHPAIEWLVLLAIILLPVGARAHGEVEGGGEQTTLRTIEGKTGKYRVEFTISPSLPVAGDDTNMELKILRILPKPDPLLGSEVPVAVKPDVSVLSEKSKAVVDRSIHLHEEGEAGVFGVDQYHFSDSGSLLLRFVIHTGAGEDLTVDFPVSVKTNVAAIFRLWVNLSIAVLIIGLTALQLWKIRARGGQPSEMVRPALIGVVCAVAVFLIMNFFVIDKVVALRKPMISTAPTTPVKANEDGSYTIPTEIQKTLGIELVAARQIPVEQVISSYGAVEAKPDRTAEVVAPLWGRIEFAKQPLAVGDKVEKGQQLVQIVLELSQVERQPMEAKQLDIKGALQRAKERRDAAQVEYERAQKLVKVNPAYEQDQKWAKQWFDETNDVYEQIAKQDRDYVGVIKFRDPRKTPVISPLSGIITTMDFTPGQLDLNGEYRKLFTISDTSVVFARGDVYLADVWKLKPGDTVLVHPSVRSERSLKGKIHWIGDTVDPITRTVPVLADVPNPNGDLAIGGFVRIEFPRSRQKAVAIPEQAIVDDGTTKRIYIAVGPETFQPMQVEMGAKQNGWWQVVSGVQQGDQVISKGAGLLGAMRPATEAQHEARSSLTEVASDE